MSLSIQKSVVEQFNFNGKNVRSIHVQESGECLIACDVYTAIGYNKESGVKALQRLVPDKYKMRLRDVNIDLDKVDKSVHLHPDTVLLKEPGLYCFLLRCGRDEAEPFMEWVVETVLRREVGIPSGSNTGLSNLLLHFLSTCWSTCFVKIKFIFLNEKKELLQLLAMMSQPENILFHALIH